MADFQFLRVDHPDVMRYLPKFLANDPRFKAVQDALSTEHENQRQILIDLAKQFFVDTATWGLTSWERVYQTFPPSGADTNLRRSMLKSKMLGRSTMTKKNMELLINQFVRDKDAYIQEETSQGCFRIIVPSLITYWDQLVDTLMEMTPAHLVCELDYEKDHIRNELHMGVAPNTHMQYTIAPATIHDSRVRAQRYIGAIPYIRRSYQIYPRTVADATAKSRWYYADGNVLHKKYTIEEE